MEKKEKNKALIRSILFWILTVVVFLVVVYFINYYLFSNDPLYFVWFVAVVFLGVGSYYALKYFKKKEENEKFTEKDRKIRLEQIKQEFSRSLRNRGSGDFNAPVFSKPIIKQGFGIQRGKVTDNN